MRLPTLFYIAVSVVAAGFRVGAQTAPSPTPSPTPPPEPIMHPAPEYAAWAIVSQSIPGLGRQTPEEVIKAVATANKPDSVTRVTKTGVVRHQETTSKARDREDLWYEYGNRIVMESAWKAPMFQRGVNSPNQPAGPDFPEFAWISPRNFVGTQQVQDTVYYVFESEITDGDAKSAKEFGYKLKTTHTRAFIDSDTRLPWLLQKDDVLQRYVFEAAPAAMLVVPPEYQTMFDTFERKKLESSRKPAAP